MDPELWRCAIFGPKIVHLPQIYFWKIINIILIHLLAPFIVQNFKNILTAEPELLRMCHFWAQNSPFPQMSFFFFFFFKKPANEPFFFHSYLSTCQKPNSDINLLVKYSRLKNTEISLAESHFWLWLKNKIFPKHIVFPKC